jgi:hypothetical protein
MATLHFICGKAASGKTTLARELAARHGAVVFVEDEWLTLLEARMTASPIRAARAAAAGGAGAPCEPIAGARHFRGVRFRRQHA